MCSERQASRSRPRQDCLQIVDRQSRPTSRSFVSSLPRPPFCLVRAAIDMDTCSRILRILLLPVRVAVLVRPRARGSLADLGVGLFGRRLGRHSNWIQFLHRNSNRRPHKRLQLLSRRQVRLRSTSHQVVRHDPHLQYPLLRCQSSSLSAGHYGEGVISDPTRDQQDPRIGQFDPRGG